MDPISQGVVGAVFAQTHGCKSDLAKATAIGACAAMVPDLDVLIRSSTDPLLALEYHRQFTHSLIMAPLGGCLCSLLIYPLLAKRWQLSYRQILFWCIVGFASHGLLDACTTYGTQLLWPLTDYRFSWNIISIVDPLFTVPLLALVGFAAFKKKKRYVVWALLWGTVYLSLGYLQHERTKTIGYELAQKRDHRISRLEVKPSFANIFVWKMIYETDTDFYVAAIKPGLFDAVIWPGEKLRRLDVKRDLPWLDSGSQQALDIERFRTFSDGYLAIDSSNDQRVVDVRYSMLPDKIEPLWGIELSTSAAIDQHVMFYTMRGDGRTALIQLIQMIIE